ncbi:hypothetical protein IE81DRAFT_345908 [Ceraceosorus guamensis]|uniref:DUF676 domain-containing protein n=1 Tax=Ceraceosorus guamensis TaxID=1522189 RepID=A0A316W3U1_9BASI|nr:hypothetical protein IE81DRAFT_345908 [Ceraceosorus guamensis]PWN44204.1 hypothetical protein IE81DRAFT_345908 [Ceraceosorus guamensis]
MTDAGNPPPDAHWDGADLGAADDGSDGENWDKIDRQGILLLLWIHGFKGSSTTTFCDFPARVAHMVQETHPNLAVCSEVYPTYETRGSLAAASEALLEWLTLRAVELECKPLTDEKTGQEVPANVSGRGLGAGSVRIVLCGHSMGGLVAVDAALSAASSAPPGPHRHDRLWPRIVGLIAFDTPYYGVHPGTFKNSATKYGGYLKQAHSIGTQLAPLGAGLGLWGASKAAANPAPANAHRIANGASPSSASSQSTGSKQEQKKSSSWSSALMIGGAAMTVLAGAAGGAYFGGGFEWLNDHFLFVSNLWDDQGLKSRLERLVDQPQIFFHALYNRLPPQPASSDRRTFIVLPPGSSPVGESFEPIECPGDIDEVGAHMAMFDSRSKTYFNMGLRAAALVAQCIDNETAETTPEATVKQESSAP